jgi:hypothetical protein
MRLSPIVVLICSSVRNCDTGLAPEQGLGGCPGVDRFGDQGP